jgi:TctA family transporter
LHIIAPETTYHDESPKWPIYNDLITGLFAAATLIECLSSKVASSSMGKSGQGRRLSSFRQSGDPTEKEIDDQCPN